MVDHSNALPLTAAGQPALHRLIEEAAGRAGAPAPDRIWLGRHAEVRGDVGVRGPGLVVGLPVAWTVSRAELAALIEHELAVLAAAPTWSASRRYRRWAGAMEDLACAEDDERPPRRAARTARRLGQRAEPVERAADLACRDAETAARALIRVDRVAADFLAFRIDVEQALSRFGELRYRVADLHDGWRRHLSGGLGPEDTSDIDADEVDMAAKQHPDLARAARRLLGRPLDLRPPADAVELEPLTVRQQRRLAAPYQVARGWLPWKTFATVPARVWRRAAAGQIRPLTAAAGRLLGRAPAGPAEVADLVGTRPAELAGVPPSDLCTAVYQQTMWCWLVEDVLLGQRWTRADPAVIGVLCGPAGQTLDAAALAGRAVADPAAYREIRRLLST